MFVCEQPVFEVLQVSYFLVLGSFRNPTAFPCGGTFGNWKRTLVHWDAMGVNIPGAD